MIVLFYISVGGKGNNTQIIFEIYYVVVLSIES